jgi:hypothetical protein
MNVPPDRVGTFPVIQSDAMEEFDSSIAIFLERERARIWALGNPLYVLVPPKEEKLF